jgi:hypothetical protein
VRAFLRDVADWQVAVVSGVLFGVLFAMGLRFVLAESWTAALVADAFTGPAFGLSMAVIRRRERRFLERFDDLNLTPQQKRAAQKATWRGPVPADPMIRAAAVQFAQVELTRLDAR